MSRTSLTSATPRTAMRAISATATMARAGGQVGRERSQATRPAVSSSAEATEGGEKRKRQEERRTDERSNDGPSPAGPPLSRRTLPARPRSLRPPGRGSHEERDR